MATNQAAKNVSDTNINIQKSPQVIVEHRSSTLDSANFAANSREAQSFTVKNSVEPPPNPHPKK